MSKVFSELEKKIVNSLLELDQGNSLNVLGNFIGDYLPENCHLEVICENDISLMLISDEIDNVDLNMIESDLFALLVTLFSLFEYLKSQRYIYFTGGYDSKTLGTVLVGKQYIPCGFIDDGLKKPLIEYTKSRFFITETFKKFVENGYKTEADIKRGEELCYTRIALVVTFISLLASIFIPLYSTTSVDIKNDVIQTSSENATKQYIEQKTNSIQRSNAQELESIRSSIKNLESNIKELSTSVKAHNENAT